MAFLGYRGVDGGVELILTQNLERGFPCFGKTANVNIRFRTLMAVADFSAQLSVPSRIPLQFLRLGCEGDKFPAVIVYPAPMLGQR